MLKKMSDDLPPIESLENPKKEGFFNRLFSSKTEVSQDKKQLIVENKKAEKNTFSKQNQKEKS